ncbi:hypothetical protein [Dyella subtropica]|uniref:hypothetical protein n=1 Tax=Dyella subtropica TaxID=2992127 RepID=UPI002258B34B|nr:hypothetical protein [Dyella subtropica]
MYHRLNRLSAVIELWDSHRDQPALGAAPRFRLNGVPADPIAKPDERYVLLDLAPGRYALDVLTKAFKPLQIPFTVTAAGTPFEAWLSCALEPGPLYVYPAYTTLIRGRLGSAAPGEVTISAEYRSARGLPRQVATRCTRDQVYTLALPGKLANPTQVSLRFVAAGGGSREQTIAVTPGTTQRVDDMFAS